MGRTSDARERLVESARELMHDRGYGAVGVGEICSAAGVNKGSFYYFFESKQLLGLAAIDEHWSRTRARWVAALEGDGQPLERIARVFDATHRAHVGARRVCGHVIGCMLGNMTLERAPHDPEVQARLREIFAEQRALIAAVLAEARAAGQLARGVTPQAGARDLVAFMQGMVLTAKLQDDPRVLSRMSKRALRLVAAD